MKHTKKYYDSIQPEYDDDLRKGMQNWRIRNFIITDKHKYTFLSAILHLFDGDKEVVFLPSTTDFWDILIHRKLYVSKNIIRKQLKVLNFPKDIPQGFSQHKIKGQIICIYKP